MSHYRHVCEYCGVWQDSHDYEHLARVCYPQQIERLRRELERLRSSGRSDLIDAPTDVAAAKTLEGA